MDGAAFWQPLVKELVAFWPLDRATNSSALAQNRQADQHQPRRGVSDVVGYMPRSAHNYFGGRESRGVAA